MEKMDTYLSALKELKEIRDRIDKIEKILNFEISSNIEKNGFSMEDLLDLIAPLRAIVLELIKSGSSTSADLSKRMDLDEETLLKRLDYLKEKGYVKEIGEEDERKYEVVMARRPPAKLSIDIWSALEKKVVR